MEISIYFIGAARAGQFDYYHRGTAPGEICLIHDGNKYWYKVPAGKIVDFKRAASIAFAGRGMPPARIIGKFPIYEVVTSC